MHPIVIIFLITFNLANIYIFYRLWKALPRVRFVRLFLVIVFLIFGGGYELGRIFHDDLPRWMVTSLVWCGSWWIGFLFYFIIFLLLLDLGFLIIRLWSRSSSPVRRRRRRLVLLGAAGVIILILAGHFNARDIRTTRVELNLGKSCGSHEDIKIAFLSDLHLGTTVGPGHLRRTLEIIETARPDLILLGGDIVDAEIDRVQEEQLSPLLNRLHAPLGVFGVTGNHEYIAGIDHSVEYLARNGITLLRDRWIMIDDSFYLAGREDRSASRRGTGRKNLNQLLAGIDPVCPLILLDHQPTAFREEAEAGADLILCGHTHHGQLFPVNLITEAIYGWSWGLTEINGSRLYISSGAGTWGPPVRIGNHPEVVILNVRFGGD